MNKLCFLPLAALALLASCSTQPALVLPPLFSDNMILQRQSNVPLWGKATSGQTVSLQPSWTTETFSTIADKQGRWKLSLPTTDTTGSQTIIVVSGADTITLRDVLLGEVWLCSGQSNMEMPLAGWGKVLNYEQEIAAANFPNIRLLHVSKRCSPQPQSDGEVEGGGWKHCSSATISEFSALAYFFGRDLHTSLNGVPVGLINASWGGTVAEAWTSAEALKVMPEFADDLAALALATNDTYERANNEWNAQFFAIDKGFEKGKPVWAAADFADDEWLPMSLPALWEERGLIEFDGMVWFRIAVDVPQDFVGKDLVLHLAEIDDDDMTFFNGVKVGETSGYNVNRRYHVPAKLVKEGRNVIAVRVMDTGGGGGLYGSPDSLFLAPTAQDVDKITLACDWKYKVAADMKQLPPRPASPNDPNHPTILYNAMIAPLVGFPIRGAIWYQGESNSSRAKQYEQLFPLLINDWRKQWDSDLAFYFVQLANFDASSNEDWPALREAQRKTLSLPNTGMAVSIDIGEDKDIHPKNKLEVARRLALWAKAKTYNLPISSYSGPLFSRSMTEKDKIRIAFTHADGGLKTNDGKPLGGFTVAGDDRIFHDATAQVVGSEVIASSPKVAHPTAVRYAWTAIRAEANLCNGEGLPASPFTSE